MQMLDISTTAGRSLSRILAEATVKLRQAGVHSAEQEAVWLLEEALHGTSLDLIVGRDRMLNLKEQTDAIALVDRRVAREPLQYILGIQEFCGLEFEVDPRVLIPRPESELLVQQVLHILNCDAAMTVVDVGTGSGCLAVALGKAIPAATVFALDLSEPSLEVARRNVHRHALEDRIMCLQGDLTAPLDHLGLMGKIDVIVSNPPYVTDEEWLQLQPEVGMFEPTSALRGGRDGTDIHKRLLEEAWKYLTPGGLLLMEMGWRQSTKVCALAVATGRYDTPTLCFDGAGIARVMRVRTLQNS